MADSASAAEAPAARAVIYTMDFDHDMVQHAQPLAQAGGNEQLAINLILNGEVNVGETGSTSAASIAAPTASFSRRTIRFRFGADAAAAAAAAAAVSSSTSKPPIALSFTDHFISKSVSLDLVAGGKLQSRQQLNAHVMRPLELMQAAAWFFARQSPGMKRHREEPPPPLGHMLTQFSPCVPVRVMCGCVATACLRLAAAPANVHVIYRTTWRWAGWIMERVTQSRVRRVQVRLQRRACCAVRCACRPSACVRCVFDAYFRKRWLVFGSVAAHRSGCIKRAARRSFLCTGCCCRPRCRQTRHFEVSRKRMLRFGAVPCDC
jgi:hypothetical protein